MKPNETPVIFLPGAGGGPLTPGLFKKNPTDRIETIAYPGWRHYVADGFSGATLVAELAEKVTAHAGEHPIRILGNSIGGHFGYAVAIHLQNAGREIEGFCAIDARLTSPEPSRGWKRRALSEAAHLLRERRIGEFAVFVRSRFWRACLRLAPEMFGKVAGFGQKPTVAGIDPIFEKELDMRLLLRETSSYLGTLDVNPVKLRAPAILLRTRDSADYDSVWHRRCPNLKVFDIPGDHHSIFEAENLDEFHRVYFAATSEWRQA
jgi:thioesterase domain-containing protein